MLHHILFILLASVTSAVISEVISWVLIYRTTSYKELKANIDKTSKKVDSIQSANLAQSKSKSKKHERYETKLKDQNKALSVAKFKSIFAVMFTMILFMGLMGSWFEGIVVAKLPFEPIGLVQGMSHRNLMGNDMKDCSMLFIYILASIGIRPQIQKLFGNTPPRGSGPSLFAPPENK